MLKKICCFAAAAALCAGAAFAQDPAPSLADIQLDHFEVVPDKEGVQVNATLRIGACGAAQEFTTSLQLISDGQVIGESAVAVTTATGDIGGTCANTRNGSCTGVACPDAIINGKRRAGTCKDGTMGGLCVCDYGVVSVSFPAGPVEQGSQLELVVDGENVLAEVSEGNNYGSITVGGKIAGSELTVYTLDAPVTFAGLSKSGLLPEGADGVVYTSRSLQKVGDTTWVVQRGVDKEGNCRSWAADLASLTAAGGVSHSCKGDPCASCEFTYDKNKNIDGCKCANSGLPDPGNNGFCNHTISSGSN